MELKDICIEIAKKYNIDTIGLFGSRARGDFQEQSDYDIFIIGNIDLNTELRLEYDLEKKLDSEVDVIKINNDIDKMFLKNILNEAIVFLDRNEAFNKTYREIENFFIENSDFIKLRERDLIG
ncbi:nucleotidyltransferase family protein [Clostridium cuniculi]|jgi:predicted nucleotidyltransferase|uniref:nucleotidyltransferase family protein n=1 Tax=Clostridium cuniculi TaxID=2548455 RepID=UPI001055F49E|nr:nucleotidyltransferase domain-containing protein [Clostridium cuniculi]